MNGRNGIFSFLISDHSHTWQIGNPVSYRSEKTMALKWKVRVEMTFALTNSGLTLRLKDCVYAPSLIANFLSCGKLNERGMDVFGKVRREGSSGRCRLGVRQRRNCCHGTTSRRNVRDGFR